MQIDRNKLNKKTNPIIPKRNVYLNLNSFNHLVDINTANNKRMQDKVFSKENEVKAVRKFPRNKYFIYAPEEILLYQKIQEDKDKPKTFGDYDTRRVVDSCVSKFNDVLNDLQKHDHFTPVRRLLPAMNASRKPTQNIVNKESNKQLDILLTEDSNVSLVKQGTSLLFKDTSSSKDRLLPKKIKSSVEVYKGETEPIHVGKDHNNTISINLKQRKSVFLNPKSFIDNDKVLSIVQKFTKKTLSPVKLKTKLMMNQIEEIKETDTINLETNTNTDTRSVAPKDKNEKFLEYDKDFYEKYNCLRKYKDKEKSREYIKGKKFI